MNYLYFTARTRAALVLVLVDRERLAAAMWGKNSANVTDSSAVSVHGTNPQNLVEKILRLGEEHLRIIIDDFDDGTTHKPLFLFRVPRLE